MSYLKKLTLIALLFSFVVGVNAQDDMQDVRIETVAVADGIYMLMGRGGNIGVSVGADGVFLVDDQFAPLTEKIKAAIAKLSDKPIRFVINTHWHFDHTGGNENLGKEGAVIVAHDNVYERMSKDGFIEAFNLKVPAAPKAALPVITFNDTVTFRLNGQEIRAVHHSHAHTDGDSVIFFTSANVIHTGDILFNGIYPFIDASSGGDVNGMIETAGRILAMANDETKIMPGHGPLATKQDLEEFRAMLILVRDRMQKLLDQGKTLDEIIAMQPNADLDKKWGGGFLNPEAFLRVLYAAMPEN